MRFGRAHLILKKKQDLVLSFYYAIIHISYPSLTALDSEWGFACLCPLGRLQTISQSYLFRVAQCLVTYRVANNYTQVNEYCPVFIAVENVGEISDCYVQLADNTGYYSLVFETVKNRYKGFRDQAWARLQFWPSPFCSCTMPFWFDFLCSR